MYIKQIIRDDSDRWVDFLKLFFTLVITLIVTILFSIPHFIGIKNKLISDSESEMSDMQAILELNSMDITAQMQILESNYNLFLMLLGKLKENQYSENCPVICDLFQKYDFWV